MKKINKILIICAIPLLLLACNEAKQSISSKPVDSTQSVSSEQNKVKQAYEDVKKLNSFSFGSMIAANQAYVLFDPQCSHCAKLWTEAKRVNGVNFNWIPVGFLNAKSTEQGAVILSSTESAKLMNLHEELLSNNMGGMVTNEVPQSGIDKVKQNTDYFKNNFKSVPVVIFQNGKTKEFGIINGAVSKAVLEDKLGLTP